MHGAQREYEQPLVTDYGDLLEITASFRAVVGVTTADLSFSSPGQQPGGGGNGGTGGSGGPPPGDGQQVLPGGSVTGGDPQGNSDADLPDTADADAPGGEDARDVGGEATGGGAAGGGSSGGGGGDSLPFTGLAVGAVAAVGSALTAAGTAVRRGVRRRTERDT